MLVLALGASFFGPAGLAEPGNPTIETTSGNEGKEAVLEYRNKAAFLGHFINYTSWPKEAFKKDKSPIQLYVIGKNPFKTFLDGTFSGKKIRGRTVQIHYVSSAPKKLNAHFVFITSLNQKDTDALIKRCHGKNIFVMSDQGGTAERGACANFYISKKKVRFEVNRGAVKKNGLKVSSQLMKLASIVKTKKGLASIQETKTKSKEGK